jgi:hypothetical protein
MSKKPKLITIEITIKEIWDISKPKIHKSKKAYSRKNKFKLDKDGE